MPKSKKKPGTFRIPVMRENFGEFLGIFGKMIRSVMRHDGKTSFAASSSADSDVAHRWIQASSSVGHY